MEVVRTLGEENSGHDLDTRPGRELDHYYRTVAADSRTRVSLREDAADLLEQRRLSIASMFVDPRISSRRHTKDPVDIRHRVY
ncbi:hypothetical protein KLO01_32790 [Knoellia locipacati]|uniref:Uncharacterized protein n=1 Tax=Knoellia locipacati TaxID=882824 RepID=A0A512T4X4_9MICO|nr:hypothetical protein KLO01_32790 [Knoellia locipacati]